MRRSEFVLIGPGRLGGRLIGRMIDAGWTCRLIRCRDARAARPVRSRLASVPIDDWEHPLPWPTVPLIMVTVPDRVIPTVASSLARSTSLDGTVVLHTSGLDDAGVLAPCRGSGASVGSWHPLQSFPASESEVRWDGVACALEGDPTALAAGEAVARALGMHPWQIEAQDKPLYHAAAAVAANLPHVLIAIARRLIDRSGAAGMPPPDALDVLVRTSVDAALTSRDMEGLTGALARGDSDTVRRHLEVLPPEVGAVYRAVAALLSSHFTDIVSD